MAGRQHGYAVTVQWTGNSGEGTKSYRSYGRQHEIKASGKPPIPGSADPAFRGDGARWNPEELLVAALSTCHKLWYLHLCSDAGVVVLAYRDQATGTMEETADGAGQFVEVTLNPQVTIAADSDEETAARLHHDASAKCFIARSVNFPVHHEPRIVQAAAV